MANHKSAQKRNRQNIKRRERNKGNRSLVKSVARDAFEAIAKDPKGSLKTISETVSVLAKTAHKGSIPKARASRKISRIYKARNKALAAANA